MARNSSYGPRLFAWLSHLRLVGSREAWPSAWLSQTGRGLYQRRGAGVVRGGGRGTLPPMPASVPMGDEMERSTADEDSPPRTLSKTLKPTEEVT